MRRFVCTACVELAVPLKFRECAACRSTYERWRQQTPGRITWRKQYAQANPALLKEWKKRSYEQNKASALERARNWRAHLKLVDRKKYLALKRQEYLARKPKHLAYQREWSQRNKIWARAWSRAYYAANLEQCREYCRKSGAKRKWGELWGSAYLINKLKRKVIEHGKGKISHGRGTSTKSQ